MTRLDDLYSLLAQVEVRIEKQVSLVEDAAKTKGKVGHHNMVIHASRAAEARAIAGIIQSRIEEAEDE